MATPANFNLAAWFPQTSTPKWDGGSPLVVRGPTYSAFKKAEFTGGTDGNQISETDLTLPLADAEYTNEISGPFGDSITGKFKALSSGNSFGGGFTGVNGKQTPDGSDLWARFYINLPTAFCAGYDTGSDGYGATKWFRLGYTGSGQRITLQLAGFTGDACAVPDVEFDHISLEIDGPEDVVTFPTAGVITRDTWYAMQFQIRFKNDGTGFVRAWLDDTYLGQVSNKDTLPAADDVLDNMVFGDYWNGTPFQDTSWYVDEIIVTTEEPNTLDSGGRPYIDPTTRVIDLIPAVEIFSLDINGSNIVQNQGSSNAQSGGGYISFLADSSNGAGTGINTTNISVIDISNDPLFGTVKGLRNVYQSGGTAYSFGNQTAFISHPERAKFYMRMRVKWSANWQWGNDQLKFCKNKSQGSGVSTNCPKFSGSGYAYITKLAPASPTQDEFNLRAVRTEADDNFNGEDTLNNGFGGAGIDQNWVPNLDQWYWLEWEIDAGVAGSASGSYKLWVDGNLYMELNNTQVAETGDTLFGGHELGHVWQNGSPTADISMDWHSIEVYDKRPSSLPGVF